MTLRRPLALLVLPLLLTLAGCGGGAAPTAAACGAPSGHPVAGTAAKKETGKKETGKAEAGGGAAKASGPTAAAGAAGEHPSATPAAPAHASAPHPAAATPEAPVEITAPEQAAQPSPSGEPRPVPVTDSREITTLTPDEAALVTRLHAVDQAQAHGVRAQEVGRSVVVALTAEGAGAASPSASPSVCAAAGAKKGTAKVSEHAEKTPAPGH